MKACLPIAIILILIVSFCATTGIDAFAFLITIIILLIIIAMISTPKIKKISSNEADESSDSITPAQKSYLESNTSTRQRSVEDSHSLLSYTEYPEDNIQQQASETPKVVEKSTVSNDINAPLLIEYIDTKKAITTREIVIQNYYYDDKNRLMINAYCDLINDFRTFIVANILKVTNCDTGEIIDSIYELIPRPQVSAQQIIKEFEHEINILIFIARADGFLRAKERDIIEMFIRSKTEYELSEDVNNIIRKLDCNINTFQKSVRKLQSKSFEDRQFIIQLMEDIINTDKNKTEMELSILKELKEKFLKK